MSNVNTYVVAYSRLRCRKNPRENRRQINRTTTVANVTEALAMNSMMRYHLQDFIKSEHLLCFI